MASKFQNRLVGTIIIVALGVIVLPGLLDGKKKHYQDEFAAIPLVPKPGDTDEIDSASQANPSLPVQPPEGAGAAVEEANKSALEDASIPLPQTPAQPATVAPQSVRPSQPATAVKPPRQENRPPVKTETRPEAKPVAKPAPKPATPAPVASPAARPATPAETPVSRPAAPAPVDTPAAAPAEQAPKGQAWVVQLGALKNAARVSEIVARLRLSGYRVFTVPATPVQGEITRIFVGPDASKQKLQSSLPELNQASGLSGQVRAYSAR
ncbi:cell division protein DedD [Biostraticola tofi]|uniref:Cell division protein DedD n=1 Tax=Biostraticola tofi TaxID=466109 RepID=A0A4V2W5M4_9GAMM|nr:cell division protein DedD [Biostraticola tofi]TCW00346.1 DedD protein [Biostraticola tofi]